MSSADKLRSALNGITFRGRGAAAVQRDALSVGHDCVRQMWIDGELPEQLGNRWIIGYRCSMSFYSISLFPITVGPKKPSRAKNSFSVEVTIGI